MYGLSYAQLGYDRMYEMDLFVLTKIIKAEMDKEVHQYDLKMRQTAWQTAYLMNATGNFKRPIKPEQLYVPLEELEKIHVEKTLKQSNIQAKRDELLKTFNIKE